MALFALGSVWWGMLSRCHFLACLIEARFSQSRHGPSPFGRPPETALAVMPAASYCPDSCTIDLETLVDLEAEGCTTL